MGHGLILGSIPGLIKELFRVASGMHSAAAKISMIWDGKATGTDSAKLPGSRCNRQGKSIRDIILQQDTGSCGIDMCFSRSWDAGSCVGKV